jgi:hypothetical protein
MLRSIRRMARQTRATNGGKQEGPVLGKRPSHRRKPGEPAVSRLSRFRSRPRSSRICRTTWAVAAKDFSGLVATSRK